MRKSTSGLIQSLRNGGERLTESARAFFESRLHYDFGRVRTHTGPRAEEAARAVHARAFTIGRDVVFGAGQFAPGTKEGQRLLAHELTHVVQQTSPSSPGPSTIQRQASSTGPTAAATPDRDKEATTAGMIVEDTATDLQAGQMKKGEFLAELRTEVCRTAEAAMAGTGRTTDDCPYLDFWFNYYSEKESQHIERAIRKYAPETSRVTAAREYIPMITVRVRRGVEVWARTGEMTGVPEGLLADSAASKRTGNSRVPASSTGNVLFKGRDGGVRAGNSPQAVQARLGDGQPLDSGVRSRMESAFGTSFSQVRAHTDANAAILSQNLNARAFSVGGHIAFGEGEYRPGTVIGDALIAHELAHVAQQRSGTLPEEAAPGYKAFEEDADQAAVGAVVSIWGGNSGLANVGRRALPGLRSGLRLQRCGRSKSKEKVEQEIVEQQQGGQTAQGDATVQEDVAVKPKTGNILDDLATKFPDAAEFIQKSPTAMTLVKEAEAAGATFGGYAKAKRDGGARPYTTAEGIIYIPQHYENNMAVVRAFLMELTNAMNKTRAAAVEADIGKLNAKEFARRIVEIEVDGMLRLGKDWTGIKKDLGGHELFNEYDNAFYMAEYTAFRDKKKSKKDIVDEVLQWKPTYDNPKDKTTEQAYIDQYNELKAK